jgi:hypothetical protein
MRWVAAATILATALGAAAANIAWASFGDSGGSGACTAAASTTRGLGCDYSSCSDRGMPRGIRHLDEGQTTYEIGSFNKLVCRAGKLERA